MALSCPQLPVIKYFEDNQISAVLRHWLGMPLSSSDCKCCGETIDSFGDHAITCKSGEGPILSPWSDKRCPFWFVLLGRSQCFQRALRLWSKNDGTCRDIDLHSFMEGKSSLMFLAGVPLYSHLDAFIGDQKPTECNWLRDVPQT